VVETAFVFSFFVPVNPRVSPAGKAFFAGDKRGLTGTKIKIFSN